MEYQELGAGRVAGGGMNANALSKDIPLTARVTDRLQDAVQRIHKMAAHSSEAHHRIYGPLPPQASGTVTPSVTSQEPDTTERHIMSLMASIHAAISDLEHAQVNFISRT